MYKSLSILILFFAYISLSQANFDFKLGYCRFKCVDPCKEEEDKDEPLGDAEKPGAFYWRDFHGVIPVDAFPLGNDNQYPKTYVGMVFEPSKNGTFVVTIVEGLDYAYVVRDGDVIKRNDHIQILCTKEPERLVWIRLTKESYTTLEGFKTVRASYQTRMENGRPQSYLNYVTQASKCQVIYAGSTAYFGDITEYALLDGTPANETNPLWLMYRDKKPGEKATIVSKNKAKSFFSHHYEYSIRKESIFPLFYKQINVGDCSLTCTNEDSGKKSNVKNDVQSLAASGYYWSPNNVFDKKEVLVVGNSYAYDELYLAQTYAASINMYTVGETIGKSVTIPVYIANTIEDKAFQLLSLDNPEMFEWVNTTTDSFAELDKTRLIPGGQEANKTEIYVCRQLHLGMKYPGGVRDDAEEGAHCFISYGPTTDFQVLMFKDPNES